MSLWLRVLHINDVYELDNFASFYSLVEHKRNHEGPDNFLCILAGDFMGPSLLSSLDKGVGMEDILNRVGITHVCFGNHECDVPMEALHKRIKEQSKFVWVNSNMQDLNGKINVDTPEYDIVEVTNATTGTSKRVGIIGLLTNEAGLYRPGAFNGAKIEPVIETAERLYQRLVNIDQNVDFVLPLTHQSMADDRIFAEHFGSSNFPLIIGGHDHNPFDEVVNGSRIVKTGYDAQNTNVIDFVWDTGGPADAPPSISVETIPTASFPPNLEIQANIDRHRQIIKDLKLAKLFRIHNWNITSGKEDSFSTKNNRLWPTHGSTALTTMLRMGVQAQCAVLNAGSIRGNSTYPNDTFFTWSDMKAEIPFPTPMVTLWVPGSVLSATIRFSRRYSRQNPPLANGCFLHTCNNIVYNDETQIIESIEGSPMQAHQLYLTAMNIHFLEGIDNLEPLLEWLVTSRVHWNAESGIPAKLILVELFSALLWLQLGSFDELDADGDGVLRREEVRASVSKHYGDPAIADLVVDNVFSIADMDGDGVISPLEMTVVHLVATDLMTSDTLLGVDDEQQLMEAMKQTAAHVLGLDDADHERVTKLVQHIKEKLYVTEGGVLKRKEHERTLGKLRRRSLLL